MTTIAWDGKVLAADGRVSGSDCSLLQDDRVKIYMSPKKNCKVRGSKLVCFAIAGDPTVKRMLESWIAEDCPLVEDFDDMDFGVLIITEDSAFTYASEMVDLYEEQTAMAIGSGRPYAFSAMKLGKSAVMAVRHATTIDLYSGGVIRYIDCRCSKPELKTVK